MGDFFGRGAKALDVDSGLAAAGRPPPRPSGTPSQGEGNCSRAGTEYGGQLMHLDESYCVTSWGFRLATALTGELGVPPRLTASAE